jgi:hypothetical protein
MSARSKRKPPNTAEQAPVAKKPRKISAIGTIPWGANNSSLIFQLLCEVEKTENFKVLFGKKDKHEVVGYPLFLWAVLISLRAEYLRRIKDQRLQTDWVRSAARYVCYRTGYRGRQGQSENGKVRTVHLWLFSSDGYIFLASSTTTSSTLSASVSLGGALVPTTNHRSSH